MIKIGMALLGIIILKFPFGRKEEDIRNVTIEDFKPIEGLDYPNV